MLKLGTPVALVMVTALATGGCGSSSSSSSSPSSSRTGAGTPRQEAQKSDGVPLVKPASSTPLTRAQLIGRANAVCRRNSHRPTIKVKTSAEFDLALAQIGAYDQAFYTELGKLAAPAPLAGDWNQIVADARSTVYYVRQLSKYPHARENAAARPIFETLLQTGSHMRSIAKRDGMADCARP